MIDDWGVCDVESRELHPKGQGCKNWRRWVEAAHPGGKP